MAYLIGTDEAGYGPNLGPLTIAGTLWRVPQEVSDLYDCLSAAVSAEKNAHNKIQICDSKQLYSPAGSIETLETSALAVLLSYSNEIPNSLADLASQLKIGSFGNQVKDTLAEWTDITLPRVASRETLHQMAEKFKHTCQGQKIELIDVRCEAVFPKRFNDLIDRYGNKAELLSTETLGLLRSLLDQCDQTVKIFCDKHGGRSQYLPLIHRCLTQEFVTVVRESRELSTYRWQENGHAIEINFQSKGEINLPTALASIIAKYFRELAMEIWNRFWCRQIDGLKPTKGYPVDAKRFKRDIEAHQRSLGISDRSIWRVK